MNARSQAMITLKATLVTAPDELRGELEPLTEFKLIQACDALDASGDIADPAVAMRRVLASLASRWLEVHEEIKTHSLNLNKLTQRAFVHKIDKRSDALHDLGAEVIEGDLLDLSSVRAAMDGVSRAYFAHPVQDGLLDATAIFASAAQECGVELVVNLSQLLERSGDQPTPYQRRHWLSEQIFAAVPVR